MSNPPVYIPPRRPTSFHQQPQQQQQQPHPPLQGRPQAYYPVYQPQPQFRPAAPQYQHQQYPQLQQQQFQQPYYRPMVFARPTGQYYQQQHNQQIPLQQITQQQLNQQQLNQQQLNHQQLNHQQLNQQHLNQHHQYRPSPVVMLPQQQFLPRPQTVHGYPQHQQNVQIQIPNRGASTQRTSNQYPGQMQLRPLSPYSQNSPQSSPGYQQQQQSYRPQINQQNQQFNLPSRGPSLEGVHRNSFTNGPSFDSTSGLFPGISLPVREASKKGNGVDELTEQGNERFDKYDSAAYDQAIGKWQSALGCPDVDLFKQSQILSNIGCALRVQGKHHESLEYFNFAHSQFCRFASNSPKKSTSSWMIMLLANSDIDVQKYEDPSIQETNNIKLKRNASVKSNTSINSSTVSLIDPATGPPVVVAYLNLASNIGNLHFSIGSFEEANRWYDLTIRLGDATFEEYPLPQGFEVPYHRLSVSEPPKKSTTSKQQLKLSYLHRQLLLSHIRSFTHLGLCCLNLGQDDEAQFYQSRAEVVLKFFAAQSPPSLSSRKSSLSSSISNQGTLYEAVVSANMGTVAHALGDLPKALELHEHAAKLFYDMNDKSALPKERGNLGCIWIDIGRVVGAVHWIRTVQKAAGAAVQDDQEVVETVFEASIPLWGAAKIDGINNLVEGGGYELENEVVSAGEKFFEKAVLMHDGMLEKSKLNGDWLGIMNSCINLAVGYTLSQQPFYALYYLTRMVYITNETQILSVPALFESHTLFVLCQALYLLVRIQPTTDFILFNNENPDLPQNAESVNNLLIALGIKDMDVNELSPEQVESLLIVCSDRLADLTNRKAPINISLGVEKRIIDSVKKRELMTKLTLGKNKWLMGTGSLKSTEPNIQNLISLPAAFRQEFCKEAEKSYFRPTAIFTKEASKVYQHQQQPDNGEQLFVDSLLQCSGGLSEQIVYETTLKNIVDQPFPSIFETASDLLGYSMYVMKTGMVDSFDLFSIFHQLDFHDGDAFQGYEVVRARLMGVALELYKRQIGFCDECIDASIHYSRMESKNDDGFAGLVPASAKGVGAKYLTDPFTSGVIVFPCIHQK